MAKSKTLVLAVSGFGKSTSACPVDTDKLKIKGLDPKETFFFNVSKKRLPVKGFNNMYQEVPIVKNRPLAESGNMLSSNSFDAIAGNIEYIIANRPDIKNLLIDDFQYTMGDYYVADTRGGYDVFKNIGKGIGKLLTACDKFKGNVFVLSHYDSAEENGKTVYKAKTVGKMVEQYITLEGKFDIVLYGQQEFSKKDGVKKFFLTNFDGTFNAKSPLGMFDDLEIPNDLGLVLEKIEEYYG